VCRVRDGLQPAVGAVVEAVRAALSVGYYAVPREATHEDVAAVLDCAPSAVSEHLRKAESALVRSVFEGI